MFASCVWCCCLSGWVTSQCDMCVCVSVLHPCMHVPLQLKGTQAPSAGGGKGVDRGKSTSGLMGEKLKLDADPSCRTSVQRSWLPGGDPGLAAVVKVGLRVPVLGCLPVCLFVCFACLIECMPECMCVHACMSDVGPVGVRCCVRACCAWGQPPAPARSADYMSLPLGGTGVPAGVTVREDGLFAAPVRGGLPPACCTSRA